MRMAIGGGVWKGRVLVNPKGPAIRPTRAEVRAALFNILGPRVQGAMVLDLFAGSGALGLEAVSRGAGHAVFVDHSHFCTDAIRASAAALGASATVTILRQDALAAIRQLAVAGQRFDLVLADPPYEDPRGTKTLQAVVDHVILAPVGVIILESTRRTVLPPSVAGRSGRGLQHVRTARYGDTTLTVYQWMTEDPS